jgi:hypothetical protein
MKAPPTAASQSLADPSRLRRPRNNLLRDHS